MTPVVTEDLNLLQGMVPPDGSAPIEPEPTPEELDLEARKAEAEKEDSEKEINDLLLEIFKEAEKEDRDERFPMLARAKRNELYFDNIQKICYDEVAQDYRSLDDAMREMADLVNSQDIKINNIYRAFAESLIAALSISVPATEFVPDDAQNPDDCETAEAYSKVSELIARHNTAQLMLIKALTILFNQGVVFGYNFANSSSEYGTYKKIDGTKTTEAPSTFNLRCKQCSEMLDSGVEPEQVQQMAQSPMECPHCGANLPPDSYEIKQTTEIPNEIEHPKCRSLYDIFGCTSVKVPLYAKKQSDCGYLILRVDDNVATFKDIYDAFADDIVASGGDNDKFDRWARLPFIYSGAAPQHLVTARYGWIRPKYYWTLGDRDKVEQVKALYPNGVMLTVINDKIVEKSHEKMDDCWTVSFDPRSRFIHGEPAGNALVPLQDVENDVFNLGIQSIAYGIPETFANPKSLNFQAYSKSSASPGMITKAIPPGPDRSISDAFHTIKPATLSGEYSTFASSVTQKTQFTTGAFPSIYGGAMGDKGSSTATEYTESRARALQRLQLTWQMISIFWGKLTFKAVQLYVENLQEDEQFAKRLKGTFVNVTISKSSLGGKVGHVEPEVNGQLPQSWAQKKDFFMSLVQMAIPEVGAILMHPNNSQMLKMITGMPDMYIPGEEDANKQAVEYYELCEGEPNGNLPSVDIDLTVDDHPVHMQVLKNILVSPQGMQLYKTNPAAYQNCILHYQRHEMAIQAKTMAPSGNTGANEPAETTAKTTQG